MDIPRPVSRKHLFMPGYGGSIQHEYNQIAMTFGKAARVSHTTAHNYKLNPRPKLELSQTFTANDYYARAPDPRRKTNSKNKSNMNLGDPRAQTFDTMNATSFKSRELPPTRAPLNEGFEDMSPHERDEIYTRALDRCGKAGVMKLENDIRQKIEQRTSGGPFALRKAFKYFDRDGSGDIDPDEFCAAMDFFGLQFTEDAVLGLFGLYDDDRGGSLGYYEFVDNIISSDKKRQGSEAFKAKCSSLTSRRGLDSVAPVGSPTSVDKNFAKAVFDMADRNGSGKIELVELEAMFSKFGLPTDSDVLNRAFLYLDKNFDGEISFEEFWSWWQTVPAFRPRGGVGEQNRAASKHRLHRERKDENIGRLGPLDIATFQDMRANSRSRRGAGTPHLLPQANGRSRGGFMSTRPIRSASAQGGDVLAQVHN